MPPVLNLLLVDDDLEGWTSRIESSFNRYVSRWPLYDRNQLRVRVHRCGSVESFKALVHELLGRQEMVYAAVDLLLPVRDGDDPDRRVWRRVIAWCLEQLQGSSQQLFDFCVMSHDPDALQELYQEHHSELQRRGIKRISKAEVEAAMDGGDGQLAGLWNDVCSFARSHLRHCTFPENQDEAPWTITVCFGDDPRLGELRYQVDLISRAPSGRLYLLFADCTGYEEEWFRLACHLRGLDIPDWEILSLRSVNPISNPNWNRLLREPPGALLVTGIDSVTSSSLSLLDSFERSDFFRQIAKRGTLAFIQFPSLQNGRSPSLSMDPQERELLQRCLQHAQGPALDQLESTYAINRHPSILSFPPQEVLRSSGVVREVILAEACQCQQRLGLADHPLDLEVAAVLEAIPWDQSDGGLSRLRLEIRDAYRMAAAGSLEPGAPVMEDHFLNSPVFQKHFRDSLGFRVRGQRLFDLLQRRYESAAGKEKDPVQAKLTGLEELHGLFCDLQKLVELHDLLKDQNKATSTADFGEEHYQPLEQAHEFLQLVFDEPEILAQRIEDFRKTMEDPVHRLHAQDFYPSLRERENWRELVETLRFIWPYDTFPLPHSVATYLRQSKVFAEFHPDFQHWLHRHPSLKEEWEALEGQQLHLRQLLQERENQRFQGETYVRDSDSQPVCLLLAVDIHEHESIDDSFTHALWSLLFFNAHVAVCEWVHRFGRAPFLPPKHATRFLNHVDQGTAVQLLDSYLQGLTESGRIRDSVFANWADPWPRENQRDVLRLVSRVGRYFATQNGPGSESTGSDLIEMVGQVGSPPHETLPVRRLLEFLVYVRNNTVKTKDTAFWKQHQDDVWDLMRRVVASLDHPTQRLALVDGHGNMARLWDRRWQGSRSSTFRQPDGGCLHVMVGPRHHPLFPIHDLVRVCPDDGSLWGLYSSSKAPGRKWLDLTFQGQGVQSREGGEQNPWLPSREEVLGSPTWKATAEGRGDG